MNEVFSVVYYNTDQVEFSEVLGVFSDLKKAINFLIKSAHYEERDDILLQYKKPTNDYKNMNELYEKVKLNLKLEDYDLYRIESVHFEE